MLKAALTAATALLFAAPAFAETWPKQDWYVMKLTAFSAQAPASAKPDGGARPPMEWMTGANSALAGPSPNAARTVAVDANALRRDGRIVDLTYYVWANDKSGVTEVTSRIDCGKTGETVVGWRQYGADLQRVAASDQSFRKIDATSRAVAQKVCSPLKKQAVSSKSLPEMIKSS